MTAYYNDIDPESAAALRQLIAEGVIAPGDVDNRSIKEVTANDVRGYTQVHFFAGAGLWSVAARLAGWPDERSIWSASCPCQPYSAAGKGLGADDPRHLWPDLYRIIRAARAAGYGPPILVGEQVAGTAGYGWFDGVRADLAREEIAARTVDIPACAIDAPHERNRLWWLAVADAEGIGGRRELAQRGSQGRAADWDLVDAAGERRGQGSAETDVLGRRPAVAGADLRECRAGSLGHGNGAREDIDASTGGPRPATRQPNGRNGSWWADAEWIQCHDGKARRAKPSIPMLVDGMVGRASVWRLAGNSIVPQLAAEVIAAYLDSERLARAPLKSVQQEK